MPKARLNGIEVYYEVHGSGYPVVFLHGFVGTTRMWEPQVPALSHDYRFVTYDARGHGRSESPPTPAGYSADIVVEDLFQLLKLLKIEKAVIGGLSMGGYESLRFYLRHPEMVTTLVLMDTGPGYRNPERREAWNREHEKRLSLLDANDLAAFAETAPSYTPRELVMKQSPVGLVNMGRWVVSQHDSLVIENLDKVKVPTLVLVGSDDTPFLQGAQYMAKVIPGASYAVIPGAGHASNMDNTPAFNKAVLDFLKKLNLPKA